MNIFKKIKELFYKENDFDRAKRIKNARTKFDRLNKKFTYKIKEEKIY